MFVPQTTKVRRKPRSYVRKDEDNRVLNLYDESEKKFRQSFKRIVKKLQDDERLEQQVQEFFIKGQIEQASKLLDSEFDPLADLIDGIFPEVGQSEIDDLTNKLNIANGLQKVIIDTNLDISFNAGSAAAAEAMRRQKLNLIREITNSQRQAIREQLTRAMEQGVGRIEASRLFRQSIGLTGRQTGAVNNYRRLLESQNADALGRALRDRRFDGTVRNAIRTNSPLSSLQMDRMTERYRSRMIDMRAETIARTESLRAVNESRQIALDQMVEDTNLDEERVIRVWNSVIDFRTRDTHMTLNGQTKRKNQRFLTITGAKLMHPGDPNAPPEETINCRCWLTTRIKELKETPEEAPIAEPTPTPEDVEPNFYNTVADDIYVYPRKQVWLRAENQNSIQAYARANGRSVQNVQREFQEQIEDMLDDADIYIRVPDDPKVLDSILDDDSIKNAFETRGPQTGPSLIQRARQENRTLGLTDDVPAERRPIYGYVSQNKNGFAVNNNGIDRTDMYGKIAFKLKPDKRPNSTVMGGDMFESVYKPTPLNRPVAIDSFDFDDAFGAPNIQRATGNHTEVHISRGVSLDDIDEVIFHVDTPSLRPYMQEFADQGIPVRVVVDDVVEEIAPSMASQRAKGFIDRLMSGEIDTSVVEDLIEEISEYGPDVLRASYGMLIGIARPTRLIGRIKPAGPLSRLKKDLKKYSIRIAQAALGQPEIVAQQGESRFFIVTHGGMATNDAFGKVVNIESRLVSDTTTGNELLAQGYWGPVVDTDGAAEALRLFRGSQGAQ